MRRCGDSGVDADARVGVGDGDNDGCGYSPEVRAAVESLRAHTLVA
jgi:hypothetical protein